MSIHRFFSIPELVALLSENAGKQDTARFARTSKHYFNVTIGHVWKEIRGIHILFALIPGVKCDHQNRNFTKLAIPDLLESDLTRFKLYAPYIMYLDIMPNQWYKYQFSGWDKLIQYSKKTTILPNLQTLVFGCQKSNDQMFIHWIIPLLSPSVVEVITNPPDSSCQSKLSMDYAQFLLEEIVKRCPAISTLSFFPVPKFFPPHYPIDDHYEDSDEDYDLSDETDPTPYLQFYAARLPVVDESDRTARDERGLDQLQANRAPYYSHMKHTRSLRSLSTTVFMLDPDALDILGSLPHLETLRLHHESSQFTYPSTLSEHSFPALRKLVLAFLDMGYVRDIWRIVPLVSRLESVSIDLARDQIGRSDQDQVDMLHLSLPTMCFLSPNIQELTIDFATSASISPRAILVETLDLLSSLSLRKLILRGVTCHDVSSACEILASFSALRDLRLPDLVLAYKDLPSFARIPALKRLEANIALHYFASISDCPTPIPTSASTLRFLGSRARPLDMLNQTQTKEVAIFLMTVFPAIQGIDWFGSTVGGMDYIHPTYDGIKCLSRELRSLVEQRDVRARVSGA